MLDAWKGKKENVKKAQDQLMKNALRNSEAALGQYKGGQASDKNVFEAGYVY